jgi:hypothetical protein
VRSDLVVNGTIRKYWSTEGGKYTSQMSVWNVGVDSVSGKGKSF